MTRATELERELLAGFAAGDTLVVRGLVGDLVSDRDGRCIRPLERVALAAAASGRNTLAWSAGRGGWQVPAQGQDPIRVHLPVRGGDPAEAVMQVCDQLPSLPPVVFVVVFADAIAGATAAGVDSNRAALMERLASFATDGALVSEGHRLVLLAGTTQLDDLILTAPGTRVITVPLPGLEERRLIIERLVARHATDPAGIGSLGISEDRAAFLSGGLTGEDLLHAFREASHSGRPVDDEWLNSRKGYSLQARSGGALVVVEDSEERTLDADIAAGWSLRAMLDDYGDERPIGVALYGPPGCGKTIMFAAVARHMGVLPLALGNVLSRWVGESQNRMDRALADARALRPAAVFIDEAQGGVARNPEGRPDGDSGTSADVYSRLLQELSDTGASSGVQYWLATNYPELLAAPLRSRLVGIPVLHPTGSDAARVVELTWMRHNRFFEPGMAREVLAGDDRVLSGRHLATAAVRASLLAPRDQEISKPHFARALQDLLVHATPVDEIIMALEALRACTCAEFLPWRAAARYGALYEAPSYLDGVIGPDGGLDMEALEDRLADLRGRGWARSA